MKTLRLLFTLAMFASLVAISSCDFGDGETHCRVKSFYWENEWYNASYNGTGRLTKLQSDDSKILFYYDEDNKLYKSDIYLPGEATARKVYTFEHGPYGITQVSYHFEGVLTQREVIVYATPTQVDSVIYQEFIDGGEVGFENPLKFVYTGSNVTKINPDESFNTYTAYSFDNKANPFKMLAASVGNPVFWPVGLYAFFPVADYDISYVSRFSGNNPLTAEYAIPSGDIFQPQTYTNTYSGGNVTKIVWEDTGFDDVLTEDYAFKYDCKCGPRVFR
ncbi:MAG: hypothetical protein HC859_01040 [Bacteroidia bacterium]|nr:hypothetical protein [Bacteroidia bacterium]